MSDKPCAGCGETRTSMFYASNKTWCRECVKKRSREYRAAHLDRYREYDRTRSDDPERVALRKRVAVQRKMNPETKKRDQAIRRAWLGRNNLKRRAHVMVNNALRGGLIKKGSCERCGATERIDAHHEDYRFPLAVTWLCEPCHGARHREINAERRGEAA